jgi:hypothetical protein
MTQCEERQLRNKKEKTKKRKASDLAKSRDLISDAHLEKIKIA